MFRRALLASASATLAGCGLAPEPPSPPEHPASPPNVFAAFDWLPAESAYRVTVEYGSRITPTNTGAIAVTSTGRETLWVAAEAARDGDDDAEPVASFPLEPGDSVVHRVDERATVRLVWRSPDGDTAILLDAWKLASQPEAGATTLTERERESAPSTGTTAADAEGGE